MGDLEDLLSSQSSQSVSSRFGERPHLKNKAENRIGRYMLSTSGLHSHLQGECAGTQMYTWTKSTLTNFLKSGIRKPM